MVLFVITRVFKNKAHDSVLRFSVANMPRLAISSSVSVALYTIPVLTWVWARTTPSMR